jgi:hypothetical protein
LAANIFAAASSIAVRVSFAPFFAMYNPSAW